MELSIEVVKKLRREKHDPMVLLGHGIPARHPEAPINESVPANSHPSISLTGASGEGIRWTSEEKKNKERWPPSLPRGFSSI